MANPRELALKILIKSQDGMYSNLALNRFLTPEISAKDRAFVTELVYGVVKYRLRLDYIISQFSKITPSRMDPNVLHILRLGVYQMIFLDRVPDFAAVNESVEMAKKLEGRGAANFVNAVLRNIARRSREILYPNREKEPEKYLSVFYSFPMWMVKRWVKLFGVDFTEELCGAFNERPKTCIRVNTLKIEREELESRFLDEGVNFQRGFYLDEALYLIDSPPLARLKSFKEGFFQPQDESSMIASIALGAKSGESVLDVAAAPGGKTTHLAQMMKNAGSITAWDIHPHRVELVKEACRRLGVTIVDVEIKDARIPNEKMFYRFDRVLIDAPCSGLGVIRRKPDIKWSKNPEDLAALKIEQANILRVCSKYVKPDGILLYSTCSIEPEENQEVVEAFLRENGDFVFDDLRPCLPEKLRAAVDKHVGCLQLYPHIHKVDGFFIARLRRLKA